MKKISHILLFSAYIFAACSVDVENPNALSSSNFWRNEIDAQSGLTAVYNMFYKPDTYSRWLWFRLDLTSDEGFSTSPWAELKEWTQFLYYNYDFMEGNKGTYQACYKAIYRANQVLHYVPDIPFADESDKNKLLAQAYFLRGLYYYNLALLWGSENRSLGISLDVSVYDMKPEGHTEDEVYGQAIDDFSEALKHLPEEWNAVEKGRATKGAAYAMRAKCYMQLRRFDMAKTDLYWLVEGEGKTHYDLVDYADNFSKDTENNRESVFEIQYSDVHKSPAGDGDNDVDPNLGLNRGQFFAPPGIGWTDGELRPWIVEEFKQERDLSGNYDIRLRHTAFYGDMHIDFPGNDRIYNRTSSEELWCGTDSKWCGRVFFRKYSSENYRDFDDYHNPINVRLIRYADVLLMYAECIAQTNGSLDDAVKLVDRVRARVNMPTLTTNHPAAASGKNTFLKRLQTERMLELATEGHRWADIKRWGLLDNQAGIDELKARDTDFDNFVIGRHYCLPIPTFENRNNPNINQNPGY